MINPVFQKPDPVHPTAKLHQLERKLEEACSHLSKGFGSMIGLSEKMQEEMLSGKCYSGLLGRQIVAGEAGVVTF